MKFIKKLKDNEMQILCIGELFLVLYSMLAVSLIRIYWEIGREYDFLYYFAVYSTGALFITLVAIDAIKALREAHQTLKWIKSQENQTIYDNLEVH